LKLFFRQKPGPAKQPNKRITIDVPLDLHQRLKAECVERGELMADVLRELIEREHPASRRRR
jgi:hypothetical protein